MGAQSFEVYVKKNSEITTAEKAFNFAVDQAIYEYGHGPYSGSIKEKNSFEMAGKANSPQDAWEKGEILIDEKFHDKWGPAGCIEVVKENAIGRSYTIKKRIEASNEFGAMRLFRRGIGPDEVLLSGPEALLKKEGKIKHVVETPAGKKVLRYVVGTYKGNFYFTSKSEAIKYAKNLAENWLDKYRDKITITVEQKKIEEETRDTAICRVLSSRELNVYEVSARAKKVSYDNAEVIGWSFFGIASC